MKIKKPKNRKAYTKTDYCNELGGQSKIIQEGYRNEKRKCN